MVNYIFLYLTYALLAVSFLRLGILLIPLLPYSAIHVLVKGHWTLVDACLFFLLIAALLIRVWHDRKSTVYFEPHGVDDPLENPKEDCLERTQFAERVFTLIDNTPIDSHMRIGIYGEWGGGKTSVLNFVKYYCSKKDNAVASFSPWQFRNRDEAWQGFIHSLDKGLSTWQRKRFGQFEREKYLIRISDWIIKLADLFPHDWAKRIGHLAIAPLKGVLKESKARLQHLLKQTLKDKRLYVFIDDLDRANPDIVYELLMLLNEVVDLSRCVYIIGLDRQATVHILEEKLGVGKGAAFLEKIINWPFDLPIPSEFGWTTLLRKEIANTPIIDADAMTLVFKNLPKNPRKFKHFIRYMGSLHKGFLERYGKDEIKCHLLYAAQLVRFEFPEQFNLIIKSPSVVEHMPSSFLDKMYEDRNKNKPPDQHEKPEWVQEFEAISNTVPPESKKRFEELFGAMREAALFMSPSEAKNHLLVVEIPELFTWKEFDDFLSQLNGQDAQTVSKKLKELISKERSQKTIESCREFIRMLQRRRHSLLEQASDVSTEPEQKSFVASASEIIKISDLLLDIPELFEGENPMFDTETIKEWYGKLAHWAHFTAPVPIYQGIRLSEKQLAIKMVTQIAKYPPHVLENVTPLFMSYRRDEVHKEFLETHKQAQRILDNGITERILHRFEQKDGIHSIWGKTVFLYEKGLIFKSPSVFHSPENYQKLKSIADKAKNNLEIQKNFIELCRMLFYSCTDFVEWARPEEVKVVIQNDEFRGMVWSAAIVKPLNGRTVGSLEEKRQKLIKSVFNNDESKLPVPQWWTDIIQGFKDRAEKDSKLTAAEAV